jgi:hypothetical protein
MEISRKIARVKDDARLVGVAKSVNSQLSHDRIFAAPADFPNRLSGCRTRRKNSAIERNFSGLPVVKNEKLLPPFWFRDSLISAQALFIF